MLDINIWKHTVATQKDSVLGPLLSGISRKNIGHVNIHITVTGSKAKRNKIIKIYPNLPFIEIKSTVPVKNDSSINNDAIPKNFVKNDYKTAKTPALIYTHSFWPNKLSKTQALKCLFNKNAGVIPRFQTLFQDMMDESKEITINQEKSKPQINHNHLIEKNCKKKEQLLKRMEKNVTNKLMLLRANAGKKQVEIEELTLKETNVNKQKNQLIDKIEELQNTIELLQQKNLEFEADPDPNIKTTMITAFQNLIEPLKEKVKEFDESLEETTMSILIYQADLIAINDLMQELQTKRTKLQKQIDHIDFEYEQLCRTEGKNPDFTISLPTSSSNQPYRLNEKAMLAEMNKHIQNSSYNLLSHNCAHVAKECVIAGITKKMRIKMKQMGVPEDFYKLKLETPLSLYHWGTELQKYLIVMNSEYVPSMK